MSRSWYIESGCMETKELKPWFLQQSNEENEQSTNCCKSCWRQIKSCWRRVKSSLCFRITSFMYAWYQIASIIMIFVLDCIKFHEYIKATSANESWSRYCCMVSIFCNSSLVITIAANGSAIWALELKDRQQSDDEISKAFIAADPKFHSRSEESWVRVSVLKCFSIFLATQMDNEQEEMIKDDADKDNTIYHQIEDIKQEELEQEYKNNYILNVNAEPEEKKKPLNKTIRDVLEELDLMEYLDIFIEQGFQNADLLHALTDEDLKNDLGIDKKGHRMQLLAAFKKLEKERQEQRWQYQFEKAWTNSCQLVFSHILCPVLTLSFGTMLGLAVVNLYQGQGYWHSIDNVLHERHFNSYWHHLKGDWESMFRLLCAFIG